MKELKVTVSIGEHTRSFTISREMTDDDTNLSFWSFNIGAVTVYIMEWLKEIGEIK